MGDPQRPPRRAATGPCARTPSRRGSAGLPGASDSGRSPRPAAVGSPPRAPSRRRTAGPAERAEPDRDLPDRPPRDPAPHPPHRARQTRRTSDRPRPPRPTTTGAPPRTLPTRRSRPAEGGGPAAVPSAGRQGALRPRTVPTCHDRPAERVEPGREAADRRWSPRAVAVGFPVACRPGGVWAPCGRAVRVGALRRVPATRSSGGRNPVVPGGRFPGCPGAADPRGSRRFPIPCIREAAAASV
ncbi:hypothetical protein GA0115245_13237 [Streptomyces sp. di188]|nr:hypothetical protein GA0115238_14477 [Streptomyces sp. di50b]SCE36551.1 hypothetical protein GA0115245_13237 [Streptomyces sp. di188]